MTPERRQEARALIKDVRNATVCPRVTHDMATFLDDALAEVARLERALGQSKEMLSAIQAQSAALDASCYKDAKTIVSLRNHITILEAKLDEVPK